MLLYVIVVLFLGYGFIHMFFNALYALHKQHDQKYKQARTASTIFFLLFVASLILALLD